ncbi:MAG: protein kinase [Lentisphaeria bacterium]|nr:protein kinase [Lentisphaeria bacterium]
MNTDCQKCGKSFSLEIPEQGGIFRCPHCKLLNCLLANTPDGELHFAGYKIIREIGQGANAYVCKAEHITTGQLRAMKLFVLETEEERHAIKEYLRESDIALEIHHPNISRLYTASEFKGIPYVVMEYIAGLNMSQVMHQFGRVDQFDALNICKGVCEALDYVWSNFLMIHRDIKPSNIILDDEGNVKVCDFGMIVDHEAASVDLDTIEGTPYYLSPESILEGSYLDNRHDLYSLGASLYHMISGCPPFNYNTIQEVVNARLKEDPPDIRDVYKTCHPDIAALIKTMMSREPEGRYNTAYECIDDCNRILNGESPVLAPNVRVRSNE